MLEPALMYAAAGLAVFPCEGKRPLPKSHGFKDATTDEGKVIDWWDREGKPWNIAIATGRVSNVVVIDIDPRNGGAITWAELIAANGAIPETWTVLTGGGGTHYYFQYPGLGDVPCTTLGLGIDVKGDGGYVLAPPSIHPQTGKAYAWEHSSGMDTPIAPMPQWMRAKLMRSETEKMATKPIPERIPDGARNQTLASVAGSLRRRGLPAAEIFEHLKITNARCITPLGEAELERIATSVGKYRVGESNGPDHPSDPATDPGEKPAGKTRAPSSELKGPTLQAVLEEEIARWLGQRKLTVNAMGDWIHPNGDLAGTNIAELAEDFANHFRRGRQYVKVSYVREILGELERERAKIQRDKLIADLLGNRGGDDSALIDWVIATTGGANGLHVAVMKHWMWQVKRAAARLPIDFQLMPVLLGPQGSGKSTAARRLCGPLHELACIPATGDMLSDSKRAPALGRFLVGVWDEMEGAERASIEAVKRTITAAKANYRPMATNASATVATTMQWFGTTNRTLASLIRDATGNRRFVEIQTLPKCDWPTITVIDYRKVWGCIDHESPAPILEHMAALVEHQGSTVYRDSVASWTLDETWEALGLAGAVPHYDPRSDLASIPCDEVRDRYFAWCDANEERPMSAGMLGQRLKEIGWGKARSRDNGSRQWHYQPPAGYRKSA